ncbi:1440_t:CDS:2, partial [Cetraspora pellucida]
NILDVIIYKFNVSEYLKDVQSKYGGFCDIHFGSKRFLLVSNSDVAYPINTSSVAHSYKFLYRDVPDPAMKDLGMEGSGIIANRNLGEWKINREFFIRIAMSKKFLKMLTEKSYEKATNMFKLWNILINDKREIDMSKWLEKFTGDIAVSTSTGLSAYSMLSYFNLLGYEQNFDYIPSSEWKQSSEIISLINSFFETVLWFNYIPSFIRHVPVISYFNKKYENGIKNLEFLLLELIQRRQHTLYKSLNRSLNDHEIFGVIRDIFLGSIETVASSMCSVFYYICKHPSVKSKALSEINEIFGHSIKLDTLYEDLNKLLYCDALIKEAIRLTPAFPALTRSNSEPVEVGGYLWKESQAFLLYYQGININKYDWIDGETFDPERFLKHEGSRRSMNAKEANNKKAFATFGGGARACPGKLWGMIELKVLLVTILMRYDMEFVNKDQGLDLYYDSSSHWRELRMRLIPRTPEA